jgi:tetratricopeptide (TPR) repeat protein
LSNTIRRLFPFAIALLLLGWHLPGLLESFQLNRLAIASVSGCGQNKPPTGLEITGTITPAKAAWLKVIQTRCSGDDIKIRAAMSEELAVSDARLDSIYATARYDVAMARFAATTYPKLAETQFWLGDSLDRQGDTAGAILAYEHGLALQDSDANVWMTVGTLYEEKGDLQAAVKAYDQACRWEDRGANGCPSAGDIYLKLGQYQLAVERYQAAIEQVGHTWPPAEKGIVTALMALGRTKEAIPHLQILAARGSAEAQQMLQQIQGSSK